MVNIPLSDLPTAAALVGADLVLVSQGTSPALSRVTTLADLVAYAGGNLLLPVNARTENYTLEVGDSGKLVTMSNAGARTLTVPPDASVSFPIGTVIFAQRLGTGSFSLLAGGGVTLIGASLVAANQYSTFKLVKSATDSWLVQGGQGWTLAGQSDVDVTALEAGSMLRWEPGGATWDSQPSPYYLKFASVTTPLVSQFLGGDVAVGNGYYKLNFADSAFRCLTAPTANFSIDVQLNGVSIGTISFLAGAFTATFTSVSLGTTPFVPGDYLTLTAPAVADATIAGIFGTLAGVRS